MSKHEDPEKFDNAHVSWAARPNEERDPVGGLLRARGARLKSRPRGKEPVWQYQGEEFSQSKLVNHLGLG